MSFDTLREAMQGDVIESHDDRYERARRLVNPRFDPRPRAIAYCTGEADVRAALQLAHREALPLAVRSGGHCTAGLSAGPDLLLDTRRMDRIERDGDTVRVGPGVSFGQLNPVLDQWGLHVPGGTCDDVCVAGFMQGGGYGLTSRPFGLNCDHVLEATVMLADGRIARCDEVRNADLLWALRGGRGGNFGVLLEVRYRLHRLREVWAFSRVWRLQDAPAALDVLQRDYTVGGTAPRLGCVAIICRQGGTPVLQVRGMVVGDEREGHDALRALESTRTLSDHELRWDTFGPYCEMNPKIHHYPRAIPESPSGAAMDKACGYLEAPLSGQRWDEIIARYLDAPEPNSMILIEFYGGAINAVPPHATAFLHRNVRMNFVTDVFWTDARGKAAATAWLDTFMAWMEPVMNGHCYPNYPRPGLADFRRRYWGEHLSTLAAIKRKYDPDQVFACVQGPGRDDGGDPLFVDVDSPIRGDA